MRSMVLGLMAGLLLMACDEAEPLPGADAGTADAMIDVGGEPEPEPEPEPDMMTAAGMLTVDAAEVDFGVVAIGGEGQAQVVVSNVGEGPAEITAFDGLDAPFGTSRSLPLTVPPGADRTIILTFAPDAEGPAMATVTIVSDAESDAATFDLLGLAGTPSAELVTERLDFGTVVPGMPASDFIEVRNTSPGLPLNVLEVTGIEAPFAVPVGQVPVSAPPGEPARVLVQFDPMADGEFGGPVTVRTDAGDFMVELAGRALTPGELVVTGVEPAWGPEDEDTVITVHGGPFAIAPDGIEVGGVELTDLALLDEWRVQGTLPALGEAEELPLGPLDVRVELGADFGVVVGGFVRTPPVGDGRPLDAEALAAGEVGPDGNPWTLAIDAIPAESELAVLPGTVIIATGRTLTVDGVLRMGAAEGTTVIAAPNAGDWGGLRFNPNMVSSSLTNVSVEGAGAEGEPAIVVAGQSASFSGLSLRRAAGPGIRVEAGGNLVLIDARLTDLAGDGVVMAAGDATVFRLQNTRMRGVQWPVTAAPVHFGRLPVGAGHDWRGNAYDAIGLGGALGADVRLANQPAGVTYRLRAPIQVPAGIRFGISAGAPLVLDGPIEVDGALDLPGGTRFVAEAGGLIDIRSMATLTTAGGMGMPTVFEARAEGGDPQPGAWAGIRMAGDAQFNGGHLVVRDAGAEGPALVIAGDVGMVDGLVVEDSAGIGLRIVADGLFSGVNLGGNAGGLVIDAGSGIITGVTRDPMPAVQFADEGLCRLWDISDLLDGMGIGASTNCP